MKLTDFEMYIEKVILARGQDYIRKGRIESLEESEPGHFIAEIAGSDEYIVDVQLDSNKQTILTSYCDCPYDWGEFCKHEAAVFYLIRERVAAGGKAAVGDELKNVIEGLSKEELSSLLLEAAEKHPDIGQSIIGRFTGEEPRIKDQSIEMDQQLMYEYINRYKWNGFIEWDDVGAALQGVDEILGKAQILATKEPERAIELCLSSLAVVIDMLGYCDDSGGEPGAAIYESIAILQEAVTDGVNGMDEAMKERVFTKLLKESSHERYEEWSDWKMDLLRATIFLCDVPSRRQRLEDNLEEMLKQPIDDDWDSSFQKEQLLLLQHKLIELYDGESRSLAFLLEHLQYNSIRELAISYYANEGNDREVIRLCEEGQSLEGASLSFVWQWKKYALQAYERLGESHKLRETLLELLYREWDGYEYFVRLKKLYTMEEWPEILAGIVEHFETKNGSSSVYLKILKEEKLYEKMLNLCQKSPAFIEQLYPSLLDVHPEKVAALFIHYIEDEASNSSNRNQYRNVCKLIKRCKKACGDEVAQQVKESLAATYRTRPAFLDELSKIG
ncbi:hypothetical protein [Bacillus testis]|uniref:hypothetical protein n=1 Tax=Bacillus testis TaxID=1622072 RepID=UPI00067E952A|nr:hypothetical protein [Bacillus testis]